MLHHEDSFHGEVGHFGGEFGHFGGEGMGFPWKKRKLAAKAHKNRKLAAKAYKKRKLAAKKTARKHRKHHARRH
ncbi:hypothetical protein Y032_0087g2013 [Ancylostoma ceylanicum]|nr:hypothetical protein Y032_0087g2013 [Ancylostoma ceylanicum]